MVRRFAPMPPDADPEALDDRIAPETGGDVDAREVPDLSSLSIAGITRRHLAGLIGVLVAVWIVVVFARQVGDAQAAASRAEQIARDNVTLSTEVTGLERELDQIQRQRYIEQQARGYGLGAAKEIPFVLSEDAPPLAADAPGSASVRLGADRARVSPLESWLTLLFGPTD
jgi:cell division protein FtsB